MGENGCGVSICWYCSTLSKISPKRLTNPEVLCWLSSATKGGLTVFAGFKVDISCLEVPDCWSSITWKEAGCADAGLGGCCTMAITVSGCVVAC